jgi:hypothetical protein
MICLCPAHPGVNLFAQVQRQIIQPAGVLPGGTRAFPTAKRLEARPGAGRSTLRAVGIGDTRFNMIVEPVDFFLRAIEASGQAIVDIVRHAHGFFNAAHARDGRNRHEHLLLPQVMIERQFGQSRFDIVAAGESPSVKTVPPVRKRPAWLISSLNCW